MSSSSGNSAAKVVAVLEGKASQTEDEIRRLKDLQRKLRLEEEELVSYISSHHEARHKAADSDSTRNGDDASVAPPFGSVN